MECGGRGVREEQTTVTVRVPRRSRPRPQLVSWPSSVPFPACLPAVAAQGSGVPRPWPPLMVLLPAALLRPA